MNKEDRFKGSYQKFRGLMMFYVEGKTSDYQLAEDIVQLVFCKFYVHMDEIAPAAEKTWLIHCTQNAVTDHFRARRCWSELYSDSDAAWTGGTLLCETMDSPEERVVRKDLAERILRDLEKVNVAWYEVMVLCFVRELSYREAAEFLHVSTDVVRSRISRARAYIREHYRGEFLEM
ncbi:MAG: sigma-70 family RNA polymerase sigma factor [Lachnospiraceae bacterium]|nr:sigma-70 family RNA polymerase sigma factor [Lachnospiraceae bacterium]